MHAWAAPDPREVARLEALRRTRRLRAAELRLLLWHSGLSASLGMPPPALVRWRMLRKLARQRHVAMFWFGLAVQRACGAGGAARAADVAAWQAL